MASASPLHLPEPRFHVVVWDYDGTLVATRHVDQMVVDRLVNRDPTAAAGAELFWSTEGDPLIERVRLAWPGREDELMPLFDPPIPPRRYPGIAPVVRELARHGLRQAVVSSRQTPSLRWGLEAAGLLRAFHAVVGLHEVSRPKPDPEGLLHALRALGAAPEHAAYVGDSDVDIQAAERAGVTSWRAAWAHPPESGAPPADAVLLRPRDVLARTLERHRRAS